MCQRFAGMAALLVAACGPSQNLDPGGESSGGDDPALPDGGVCAEQALPVRVGPVRMMITLDMSGSMMIPSPAKYDSARNAIIEMVNTYADTVAFGFDTYPDNHYFNSCEAANPLLYDSAFGNNAAIAGWLSSHVPVDGAADPLVRQLDQLLLPGYAPAFQDASAPGPRYILIVADGDDCCGPNGQIDCGAVWIPEMVQRTEALLAAGIQTVVVGYTQHADPQALGAIAAAGGTRYESFIPALDAAALRAALADIATSVASCTFQLDPPDGSADPDSVNVFVDGAVVPFDDACAAGTGWKWGDASHTTVELCVAACDRIRDGAGHEVTARFGCPPVVVE